MPTLTVDGRRVKVNSDATLLDAARAAGVEVPTLCHFDGLEPWGGCRLCVVDMSRAEPHVPEFSSGYLDFTSRRGVGWYAHTHRISPTGVLGDPTRASAEKGRQMWEIIVRNLTELVEDLKGLSLEEIHQRRY